MSEEVIVPTTETEVSPVVENTSTEVVAEVAVATETVAEVAVPVVEAIEEVVA